MTLHYVVVVVDELFTAAVLSSLFIAPLSSRGALTSSLTREPINMLMLPASGPPVLIDY